MIIPIIIPTNAIARGVQKLKDKFGKKKEADTI